MTTVTINDIILSVLYQMINFLINTYDKMLKNLEIIIKHTYILRKR